jgi:hypothetical protein
MDFVTPPKEMRGERSKRWVEIVDTLRANVGEWGLVGNYSPGIATHIRRGSYPAFLPDDLSIDKQVYMSQHWEITTRKNGESRQDVYVRWLG